MSKYSKIQIRALVLQAVLKFKNQNIPSDSEIEKCIKYLSELGECKLVSSILLKEISANSSNYDNIITLLLLAISKPEILSSLIFKLLNSPNVTDAKKLFLINILREQGLNIDYNFIQSHVKNPDAVINSETKRFLHDARVSPEVQIDFFDFYFTVSKQDRNMLVDSIIEDYTGDELANILEPFVYFYPEVHLNEKILTALVNSKSLIALKCLEWCSSNYSDSNIARLADKCHKKMILSGLNPNVSNSVVFKSFLSDSKPLNFWYSCADGNSNISCVFARQLDTGFIQTFFTVFNLYNGPIASFGFNELALHDFKIILHRFFKTSLHCNVNLNEGKLIFDCLCNRGWKNNVNVPYEFICWRHLTFDIDATECDFSSLLLSDLKIVKISEDIMDEIINSDMLSTWFYTPDNLSIVARSVEFLKVNKINDIKQIDDFIFNLTREFIQVKSNLQSFLEQVYFQSYILKKSNMINSANALFTISKSDSLVCRLLYELVKKSLYFYYVNIAHVYNGEKQSVFSRCIIDFDEYKSACALIKLFEEKWT